MQVYDSFSDHQSFKFIGEIARDMVRLAASAEGLEAWPAANAVSTGSCAVLGHRIADAVYGDEEEAAVFRCAMTLELDAHVGRA